MKPTRKTKRLIIRPLELSDYEAWSEAQVSRRPQQNRWDRGPRKAEEVTKQAFKSVVKSQAKLRAEDKFFDLAVFEKSSGKVIGTVAVMDILRGLGQSAYIGYFIDNNHWGKGIGKEAVRALIDIAFRDLRLHRVEAGIEPTNRRSIFLAKSLGLRREGLKKRAVYLYDEWIDLSIYSATCEEFGVKWKGVAKTRLR